MILKASDQGRNGFEQALLEAFRRASRGYGAHERCRQRVLGERAAADAGFSPRQPDFGLVPARLAEAGSQTRGPALEFVRRCGDHRDRGDALPGELLVQIQP